MADGFTVTIEEDLARDLERRARKAGVSRDAFVLQVLQREAVDYDDFEWIGDDPRTTPLDSGDEEGGGRPLEEVMAEFRAELDARLARRR
jgi:hypothetical protein